MNLLYALKNVNHPLNRKKFVKHPVSFKTVAFIYKFGIFHISVVNKKLAISYGWETAYFFGMMNMVSVIATLSFQFNNTYLLTLMISTIEQLTKEIVLSHAEVMPHF